nr:MAG TPA: hypothetical protein [Caudoviricetes sp.]
MRKCNAQALDPPRFLPSLGGCSKNPKKALKQPKK